MTDRACLPCFRRQVSRTLSYAGVNGSRGSALAQQAERIIEETTLDQAPARISTLLHRLIRNETGVDPYRRIKEEYNRIALDLLPEVRRRAAAADGGDRVAGGVRAAIAGNIIDFGIYDSIDLERALQASWDHPLFTDDYRAFRRAAEGAERILYLCDNAGEIVFDRILIEVLRGQGKDVTAVVKGAPVINDATLDDARAAGLEQSATRLIQNGNDGIGTLLELCSDEFRDAYGRADLIISKGQANFETLFPEGDERTFFLFMVKCPVVARELGNAEGAIVLMQGRPAAAGNDRRK